MANKQDLKQDIERGAEREKDALYRWTGENALLGDAMAHVYLAIGDVVYDNVSPTEQPLLHGNQYTDGSGLTVVRSSSATHARINGSLGYVSDRLKVRGIDLDGIPFTNLMSHRVRRILRGGFNERRYLPYYMISLLSEPGVGALETGFVFKALSTPEGRHRYYLHHARDGYRVGTTLWRDSFSDESKSASGINPRDVALAARILRLYTKHFESGVLQSVQTHRADSGLPQSKADPYPLDSKLNRIVDGLVNIGQRLLPQTKQHPAVDK